MKRLLSSCTKILSKSGMITRLPRMTKEEERKRSKRMKNARKPSRR